MRRLIGLSLLVVFAIATSGAQQRASSSSDSSPYSRWSRGPSSDPGYFPIAVWLQSPSRAAEYKAAGINLYVALWEGPTSPQLAQLKAAGMQVIVGQSSRSLAFIDNPTIVGWMHGDEPDNAQPTTDPVTGKKGYGPCVPPEKIVAEYQQMRAADPTRPILLNLGQGVANDAWIGRGSGAKLDDYKTYVKGSDIPSFDVYPVASALSPGDGDNLGYISKGLDRLAKWTGGTQPVWNCIECTRIDGDHKATPEQVRAEVWLALIHGSRGLIYFVHQFKPTFNEHALLDDPEMLRSVTETNRRIKDLAPVLNSTGIGVAVTAVSQAGKPTIDVMSKQYRGATYLFAVNSHPVHVRATISIQGISKRSRIEVIGESRSLINDVGRFGDDFPPYCARVYTVK